MSETFRKINCQNDTHTRTDTTEREDQIDQLLLAVRDRQQQKYTHFRLFFSFSFFVSFPFRYLDNPKCHQQALGLLFSHFSSTVTRTLREMSLFPGKEKKRRKRQGLCWCVCVCTHIGAEPTYDRAADEEEEEEGGKAGYITNTRQRIRRDRTDTFAPESRKVDCRNPIGFCNGHPANVTAGKREAVSILLYSVSCIYVQYM